MEARKQLTPEEMLFSALCVENRMPSEGYASINSDLIERGEVLKSLVYQDEKNEISLLMLSPKAKIKKHRHNGEKEWYYHIRERVIQLCRDGDEHELENPSETEWLSVLSIKNKTK